MKSKKFRIAAVVGILGITIAAFIYFILKHPTIIDRLRHTSPLLVLLLLGLYAIVTVLLVFVTQYSLEVGRAKIPFRDNILLTCYSSIINFFGPLQSGPGFRIVYLKKRYNISIKNYTLATFMYYGFFALISGVFLCANVLPWWGTVLVVLAISGLSLVIIRKKRSTSTMHFSVEAITKLGIATFAQVFITAIIYFLELHSVDHTVKFTQAITYTGVANFALFVSLTPGAIGFRESFLLFTQRLHHINSSNILTASLIDRGVYILFLGILFLLSVAFHVGDRLKDKKATTKSIEPTE